MGHPMPLVGAFRIFGLLKPDLGAATIGWTFANGWHGDLSKKESSWARQRNMRMK